MKIRAIDPICRRDISIATEAEPFEFAVIFRRVGRKEQKRLLDEVNSWRSSAIFGDDADTQALRQEIFLQDLVQRFEGLPVEDDGLGDEPAASVRTLITGIITRSYEGRKLSDHQTVEELIENDVARILSDPDERRHYEELDAVLDDALVFTKVLNAAIESVVNAGIERSKN